VVVSVIEELAVRDGLDSALGGRDAVSLTLLLRFLSKYIVEPRYGKLMCNVLHHLLDLYASVVSNCCDAPKLSTHIAIYCNSNM
jgi:U3 small nucleolar RNA-associated protein 15